ncbi:hypothetical protein [Flavobacterium ajazii]|uniref:hypothetical protein n=1 Tax=Flavobacterium ajazii TaxID=2692318 RepID=UPI0013D11F15|nr:hypothetical protein [Flavobacterium ajazii]
MKKILISVVFINYVTYGAPTPPPPGLPPPASVNINKEIHVLVVAGLFLGVFWIRKSRRSQTQL